MRLKQLFGVVALFAVGLVGCGPIDGDGQVAFPIHVTVESPTSATVFVNLDYELYGELGVRLDEGEILREDLVRDGETFVVDGAFFASPGNELSLGLSISVDEQLYGAGDRVLLLIGEDTTGVDIRIINREELGKWVVDIVPLTATAETPVE